MRTALAFAQDTLNAQQREDIVLAELFTRVREEIELSRARGPTLLMPGTSANEAADALTLALRFAKPGEDRGEIMRRAAALMAVAARLALEGTPVFPHSLAEGRR